MTKTYCGKDCSVCMDKEALNCTGCTDEENRMQNKDCEIAGCCVKKGHEDCATCVLHDGCGTIKRRERMSSNRIKQREEEEHRKAEVLRKAPIMAKWMKLLFWFSCIMIILDFAVSFALNGSVITEIFSYAVAAAYSVILLKMAKAEELYKTAGCFGLAAAVIGLIAAWICRDMQDDVMVSVIAVIPGILGFIYEYCEYMSHASVLKEANAEMSEKWENLWKWYIGLIIAIVSCIVIVLISPVLGGILMLAGTIGLLVLGFVKIAYLHEPADIFQKIVDQNGVE